MTLSANAERDLEQACRLLEEYSFDLGGYPAENLVSLWQQHLETEPSWIRAAVLEALYQGRYKAFSVEQILRLWKRRGHPMRHYNHDFERVVFGPMDPSVLSYAPPPTLAPWSPEGTGGHEQPPPEETRLGNAPEPVRMSPPNDGAATAVSEGEGAARAASLGADSGEPISSQDQTVAPYPTTPSRKLPQDVLPSPRTALGYAMPDLEIQTSLGGRRVDPFSHPAPIQTFEPMAMGSGFHHRLEAIARQFPA